MPKPNDKFTVKQMKDYIRTHKLNHPEIKLSMRKADMIAGLKKHGHWEGSKQATPKKKVSPKKITPKKSKPTVTTELMNMAPDISDMIGNTIKANMKKIVVVEPTNTMSGYVGFVDNEVSEYGGYSVSRGFDIEGNKNDYTLKHNDWGFQPSMPAPKSFKRQLSVAGQKRNKALYEKFFKEAHWRHYDDFHIKNNYNRNLPKMFI